MEKIYSENLERGAAIQATKETINFLLSFSKQFHVVEYKSFQFENSLN
ncbi:hypothetical protein [Zobellia barbeyronii]|uniref:Uncharacterized protein n=1 Tax=Zobellia barbeyronii TaxID=2748009 RepID=A0ABS5WCB2_9FLAO|nr:hypothetical protein [Zobellia barbeyronii]MBT2160700.1 hypothetical protein [Zobellia barbeyronii]